MSKQVAISLELIEECIERLGLVSWNGARLGSTTFTSFDEECRAADDYLRWTDAIVNVGKVISILSEAYDRGASKSRSMQFEDRIDSLVVWSYNKQAKSRIAARKRRETKKIQSRNDAAQAAKQRRRTPSK
jgi:hypothetical protein